MLGGLRIGLLCGISITLEVMCSVYGCRGASTRDLPFSAAYFVDFSAHGAAPNSDSPVAFFLSTALLSPC